MISVGRVMTCVLGMVVRKRTADQEFGLNLPLLPGDGLFRRMEPLSKENGGQSRVPRWFESFDLYKDNGFKEKEKAEELIRYLKETDPYIRKVASVEKKGEEICTAAI